MQFIADLHTHTLASGHAYSTIKEMAQAASQKGIKLLGITEHSLNMPGTCKEFYFQNLRVLDREMFGVELLFGAELNVVDYDGHVDMEERTLKQLDIAVASFHIPCIAPGTMEQNTHAAIEAMKNKYVNILGHPDDGRYPLDYEALAKAAKETETILELNNSSLSPTSFRQNSKENACEMLKCCMKYGTYVMADSDAHVDKDIGMHQYADEVLQAVGFPEELLLNNKIELIKKLILKKRAGL